MVLSDVLKSTYRIIGIAATFYRKLLKEFDMHLIDRLCIPERLEHRIEETKCHHVLQSFLGKIMVDAEDLFFFEQFSQKFIECTSSLKVIAKWLLDKNTRPTG